MRHLITHGDLPPNLRCDDFGTHWIHPQPDPAALRSLNEGWHGVFRRTTFTGLDGGPRYTKLETDAAGRKLKQIQPAFGGGVAETVYSHEAGHSCGRPGVVLRPGQPAEVFEYDSLVEVSRSGLSGDGNTLVLNSADDRISEKTVLFESDTTVTPHALWQVSSSYVYPTATKKLVSLTRTQMVGLKGNEITRQVTTDVGGTVSTVVTTLDRLNCLSQTLASNSVTTGVSTLVVRADRPTLSRGAADAADKVTTYDALGRVTAVQALGHANPEITTYQPGKGRVGTVQAPHGFVTTYVYEN